MVEKYRGITPPDSIYFKLNRNESIALLKYQGILEDLSSEQIATLESSEIQAFKGKASEIERMLTNAGLKIITLYD
jgi:hypothetical protein